MQLRGPLDLPVGSRPESLTYEFERERVEDLSQFLLMDDPGTGALR
jgi:hypothetical protein